MKTIKLLTLAALTFTIASCASPEERAARLNNTVDTSKSTTETTAEAAVTDSNKTDTMAAAPAPAAPVEPAKEESVGEGLIKKSDCLACHNATKKLVGPAYVNVAGKYPANEENIALLADKIINGGAGVWGDVPMSPHPSVSKDDAKEMVKYILSLKK
ncbi:MAG: c-type cytochrome [Pedobacter sp.]|nr:MAG: c-type cytochrome [Pedobacter sp.]